MGCDQTSTAIFKKRTSDVTGLDFVNHIEETAELNIMQYEYLYNGGGIGVGDFNGDGFQDIYVTGNMVKNRLYLNQTKLRFKDVTQTAKVSGKNGWSTGVTIADVNADGLLDIYVCYSGVGSAAQRSNELFINQGNDANNTPIFKEMAKVYGLDAVGSYSTQAAFFDYDRDGDLDMFLLNHSKSYYSPFYNSTKLRNTRHPQYGNVLYKNDNGLFKDISKEAGIHGSGLNFGLGLAISDINLDGWPDIYVSNDYEEQDFLYINQKDGTFLDATKQAMNHISKFSMGNDIADFNNDGKVDLVTLDMLPEDNYRQKLLKGADEYERYQLAVDSGYHKQHMRNMLQINQGLDSKGIPRFSEIGQLAGISNTDWSWAPLWADFNADGKKDLLVTNGYLRDYTNRDFMKFEMNEAVSKYRAKGIELFGEKGKSKYANVIFDLVKKMPSTKLPNYIFQNNGDYHFKDVTEAYGLLDATVSTGAAYADFDNDGDLDLIIHNTNEEIGFYENTIQNKTTLNLKLVGEPDNPFAIGAKVYVTTNQEEQYLENYWTRGYQSSISPILNFGLGTVQKATVKVLWPNSSVTIKEVSSLDQVVEIRQTNAKMGMLQSHNKIDSILRTATIDGLKYLHQENAYNDFRNSRLTLKEITKQGPCISIADINNDNLPDIFVGGAYGYRDVIYMAKPNGGYELNNNQFLNSETYETTSASFFDADLDGDKDLYLVSGGGQANKGMEVLADRLYLNDGSGNFTKTTDVLPQAFANGSVVVASDYDNDGDVDLYVGGGSKPNAYPESDLGGILKNELKESGTLKFKIATNEVNPELRNPGLIMDAAWADLDANGYPDLVLVGEWMPIKIYYNTEGKLAENPQIQGSLLNGLWSCVKVVDLDQDGDLDLLVGNAGNNLPFKASKKEPVEAFTGDFTKNGFKTTVITNFEKGKRYPIHSLDEYQDAFPFLKKKFLKHEQFANATIEEIFSNEQLQDANQTKVEELESIWLENNEDGFSIHYLPTICQTAPIAAFHTADYNNDGFLDVLTVGNFNPFRVQYGPVDANYGQVLLGGEDKQFKTISQDKVGVYVTGEVRALEQLSFQNNNYILLLKNQDSLEVLQY
jgi:hypothetical protein